MAMSKPQIRVAFSDLPEIDNFIIPLLRQKYDLVIDEENPDYLFYSCMGADHIKYKNCVKIFITIESVIPDFNACDYAVSCRRIHFEDRHYYCPPSLTYNAGKSFALPQISEESTKRRFCSFLYSRMTETKGTDLRRDFCVHLMESYKHVDCPGKVLHNIDVPSLSARYDVGNWRESKIAFLSQYKFNIAFENADIDGYITEKLMDCFLAGTVPIYWGSSRDLAPFPKSAVICAHDYPDFDSLVARIREVDEDDELYMSILRANPLLNGMKPNDDDGLLAFFDGIFSGELQQVHHDGLYDKVCTSVAQLEFILYGIKLVRVLCYLPASVIWAACKLAEKMTSGEKRMKFRRKREAWGRFASVIRNCMR